LKECYLGRCNRFVGYLESLKRELKAGISLLYLPKAGVGSNESLKRELKD